VEVSGGARLSRWVGGVAALVSQCCSRVLCLGLALLLGAGLAVAADTVGPLSPSSNSGGWTDASNAYADGGGYAYTTANDYHSYYGFDFSGPNDIPDGALIDSITIYIDISAVPTCIGCVNLTYSLDGGTNWIPANWLSAGSSESTESVTYTVNDYVATDVESQLQLRIGHNDPGRATRSPSRSTSPRT